MNKPDWKDAPEWANYLAMDNSGEWWAHEFIPTKEYEDLVWLQPLEGRCEFVMSDNEFDCMSCEEDGMPWYETLEKRTKEARP